MINFGNTCAKNLLTLLKSPFKLVVVELIF